MAADRPELQDAIEKIDRWCSNHRSLPVIDPRRVAHETHLPAATLTKALFYLVDRNLLEQVYRFETPAGYLLSEEYSSILDVPDSLRDRYDEVVHRWEGDVVPVFREVR